MLADKDIQSVVNLLRPQIKTWHIAPMQVPRAASLEQLQTALADAQVACFENIQSAFAMALTQAKAHQLILVCGSFHTLEAVWEYLEQHGDE